MAKIKLSELSLREKIGQTYLIKGNFWENVADKEEFLKKNPVCGVWSFGRPSKNTEEIADFNGITSGAKEGSIYSGVIPGQMSRYLKIPPVIGADTVSGFSDLSPVPSVAAIGATGRLDLAYRHGQCIADEFKCAGVRWRWSPCTDLFHREKGSMINRTFSDDCKLLTDMAIEYVKGCQSQGVAACVKHFPGAGIYAKGDTHFVPECNNMTFDEWEQSQGKIYQDIINSGVWSVMISHASFPAVDDTKVGKRYIPSTFSKKVITDLLKGKMGFGGVVITDDMFMRSCKSIFNREEMYINALNAGNDILLGPEMEPDFQPGYIDVIEQAVKDGRVSIERIDDACRRVLEFKEKLSLFEPEIYFAEQYPQKAVTNTEALCQEIAQNALTLVTNEADFLPVSKNNIKNIAIVTFAHDDGFFKAMDELKEIFEGRGFNVCVYDKLTQKLSKEIADNNDLIIYSTFIGAHAPYGAPSFYGDVMKSFFNVLSFGAEKSICVSFGSPYIFHDYFDGCDTFINAYCYDRAMLEAFAQGIFGEIPFLGKSPFKLIP